MVPDIVPSLLSSSILISSTLVVGGSGGRRQGIRFSLSLGAIGDLVKFSVGLVPSSLSGNQLRIWLDCHSEYVNKNS